MLSTRMRVRLIFCLILFVNKCSIYEKINQACAMLGLITEGCSQLDTRSTRHVCRVDSITKKSTRHKSTRHTVISTQLDTYVNLKA